MKQISHLTPINVGRSPGAVFSDITFKEFTWLSASTVAATNQGRPNIEHIPIEIPIINKSTW
jgi:hypothetical protein